MADRANNKAKNPTLTREEVEKAFDQCDSGGTGFIAMKRLKIVMRAMGLEPRQAEIDKLTAKMAANDAARQVSSDSFTLEELRYVLEDRLDDEDCGGREIHGAFELFDTQGKGYINFSDLKRVAKELGEDEVDDKQLWEMIHFADFSKRGRVTEEDFKVIMKKTKMY